MMDIIRDCSAKWKEELAALPVSNSEICETLLFGDVSSGRSIIVGCNVY